MKSRVQQSSVRRVSRHWFVSGVVAACAFLFGGCASTTYDVKVTARARPETAPARSYRIADQVVDAKHRPVYLAAGKVVRSALATKGLTEVTNGAEPDLIIAFNCGVGPPNLRRTTESEAVYVMVPGPIRYETVQVGTTASGAPIYQTVARQDPPTQQLAGYQDIPIEVTTFQKQFRMTAVENKGFADQAGRVVAWKIEVACDGEDKDLTKSLPVLAAACMAFVGKNSDGTEIIRIKDTDHDVTAIKRGR